MCQHCTCNILRNVFGFHVSSRAALPKMLPESAEAKRCSTCSHSNQERDRGRHDPSPPPSPPPNPAFPCEYEHRGSNEDSEIKPNSPLLVLSLSPMKIKMTLDTLRCLHNYAVLHTRCRCSSLRLPRNIAQQEGRVDRSKLNIDVMLITPHVK